MIYQITSDTWAGYIEIEFDPNGYMVRTDTTHATLTEPQQKWFLVKMPRELSELERVIKGTSAKLTEIKREVGFDEAWERYGYKNGLKEAKAKWAKMHRADQLKAYEHIPRYYAKKPDTQAIMYFATYLNRERWNDK